jgi:hypothetical protein
MRIITTLFIFIGFMPMNAQESPPRWQVGVHSGLFTAITSASERNNLGAYSEDLQNYEADINESFFTVSDIALALDVNYTLFPFLRANFNFAYSGLANTKTQGRSGSSSNFVIRTSDINYSRSSLNACFDLLYQDPYESLSFIIGVGYNYLYNRVFYSIDSAGQGPNNVGMASSFTRTMRQVRYFNLNLAVEWRDYITPNFGYFIRLGYMPLTQANTHSILLEKVQINGQTHPLEGETLKPGEKGLPDENYEFQFINLSLGLTYQW